MELSQLFCGTLFFIVSRHPTQEIWSQEIHGDWVCADDAISGITNLVMPLLALLIILASRARYVHSYVSYRHTQVPTGRYWCPLSGP